MFYLPKILWDQFEQGRMNQICKEILSITKISKDYSKKVKEVADKVELVSKELNNLAAILHVYAGTLIFMK